MSIHTQCDVDNASDTNSIVISLTILWRVEGGGSEVQGQPLATQIEGQQGLHFFSLQGVEVPHDFCLLPVVFIVYLVINAFIQIAFVIFICLFSEHVCQCTRRPMIFIS